MKRKFIIGNTLDSALQKYPIETTVHEIPNPFNLNSSTLELKLIFGILANKSKNDRELTQTESKHLKWVSRMYPDVLEYRYFGLAIKFTPEEKNEFIDHMKEIYDKKRVKLSNIYRIMIFSM